MFDYISQNKKPQTGVEMPPYLRFMFCSEGGNRTLHLRVMNPAL